VRLVTSGVWLLAPALAAWGIADVHSGRSIAGVVLVVAGVGVAIMCVVCRRLQPVAYELDGTGLTVERRKSQQRRFVGALSSIPGARLGLRVAGSGGLYGYLGRFRLVGGGRASAFVTDRSATAIVRVGDAVLAVSPADRDAFLSEVEEASGA
jgi:hypothetical protein